MILSLETEFYNSPSELLDSDDKEQFFSSFGSNRTNGSHVSTINRLVPFPINQSD
jgi:hypothetical protein